MQTAVKDWGGYIYIYLDLHDVGLPLTVGTLATNLGHLGVGNDADDSAVLLDALELVSDLLLARVILVLLGVPTRGLMIMHKYNIR